MKRWFLLALVALLVGCGAGGQPGAEPQAERPTPTAALPPTEAGPPPDGSANATAAAALDDVSLAPPASFAEVGEWLAMFAGGTFGPDIMKQALMQGGYLGATTDWQVADLNGDQQDEWVIRTTDPTVEAMAWGVPGSVLIVEPSASEVVYQGGYPVDPFLAPALPALQDLTGDGLPEVIYEMTTCGANTCTQEYHVVSYQNGRALSEILTGPEAEPITMSYSESAVQEQTGDGVADLVLVGGTMGSAGAGPQRARTEVYAWKGQALALARTDYEATPLRYFKLLDANNAFDAGDYEAAIQLYDEAATSAELEASGWPQSGDEEGAIRRFAGFRLVASYLALDDTENAQRRVAWLRDGYPDDPITQAAAALVETYSDERALAAACAAVTPDLTRTPDLTAPLDNMGYANPTLTPDTLCPLS